MKFRRVDPNWHHPVLRLASESGRWNIGLWQGTDGLRLRMGLDGRRPDVIDVCLGPEPSHYAPIVIAIVTVAESLPEAASAKEIDAAFPWQGTRPNLAIHLPALSKITSDSRWHPTNNPVASPPAQAAARVK